MTQPTDADDLRARFDGDGEAAVIPGPFEIPADFSEWLNQNVRRFRTAQMDEDEIALAAWNQATLRADAEIVSLRERLAKAESRTTAAETAAAQMHGNSDGYQGAISEIQHLKQLIAWAAPMVAEHSAFVGDKHLSELMVDALGERSAAATAPQGGRE
jgi:hypothetical protein